MYLSSNLIFYCRFVSRLNDFIFPWLLVRQSGEYIAVRDSGVIGAFCNLEKAKQALIGIDSGNRLIAEINIEGTLKRDPHVISGQDQTPTNGFNKYWTNNPANQVLMDKVQKYIVEHPGIRDLTFKFNLY